MLPPFYSQPLILLLDCACSSIILDSNRGWGTSSLKFSVIGTFEKLRASVNDQSPEGTSAFLWETFTTKPYHDNGEVLRIGEITTPWPCFMVASTKEFVADPQNAAAVTRMLAAVDKACQVRSMHTLLQCSIYDPIRSHYYFSPIPRFGFLTLPHIDILSSHFYTHIQAFASEPGIVEEVSKRYGNKLEDAKNWYSAVSIAPSFAITESSITKAIEALKAVGLVPVDKTYDPSAFVAPELASIRTDIGSMKLYNKPELLIATLASLRQHNLASGQVSYKQLLPFDQNHYNGTTALDECVAATGLTKGSRALNVSNRHRNAPYINAHALSFSLISLILFYSLLSFNILLLRTFPFPPLPLPYFPPSLSLSLFHTVGLQRGRSGPVPRRRVRSGGHSHRDPAGPALTSTGTHTGS